MKGTLQLKTRKMQLKKKLKSNLSKVSRVPVPKVVKKTKIKIDQRV